MYIDLHGHSRKYNVFMYGCDDKKKAKPLVRAFPKFFSSHPVGGKYVSYADCSFHVRKGRESTARVVVSKELNIPLSFTLEATFCGSNYGPYQVTDSRFFFNFFNFFKFHL
jgi:cytosolic carboxypeptidase protein 2/3